MDTVFDFDDNQSEQDNKNTPFLVLVQERSLNLELM